MLGDHATHFWPCTKEQKETKNFATQIIRSRDLGIFVHSSPVTQCTASKHGSNKGQMWDVKQDVLHATGGMFSSFPSEELVQYPVLYMHHPIPSCHEIIQSLKETLGGSASTSDLSLICRNTYRMAAARHWRSERTWFREEGDLACK